MMDGKTQRFLNKLNQRAAEMFKTKVVKDDTSRELKERAEWAYKKTGDERIRKQIDAGAFESRDKRVVDERSTREIDKFYEAQIKRAIASGEIEPAKKDAFMKKFGKQ